MSFVVVLPFFIQSFFLHLPSDRLYLHSFPTRRSSDILHLCSMHPKNISIKDFTYDLPNERIATYPLHPRDSSKLLVYNKGTITYDVYSKMSEHLPKDAVFVFNNTRVINSSLHFVRETDRK